MRISKFVDPLPIPQTLKPDFKKNGVTRYTVKMKQAFQSLHRDLPKTKLWGYNGVFPGPKFEVRKGELVDVLWENKLPKKHLLPVDTSIHGAQKSNPRVRTVVHLHGAKVRSDSDGYPEAWFTRDFEKTGPSYKHKIYRYTNNQRPTMLWYHDHALGITRLNLYSGLAGIYFIRDEQEAALPLPKGPYEIPLVITDRTVKPDGSLYYPKRPMPSSLKNPKSKIPYPSVVPEFFGKQILVNGKIWPYLNVEPRRYRFRILNASNSRFYNLKLSSGQPLYQIGSDGGLLKKPVKLNEILIAPAERIDVIVDFSKMAGKRIILTNNAAAPFPNGDPKNFNSKTTGIIMQFRVNLPLRGKDTSRIPPVLSKLIKLSTKNVKKVRNLSLDEGYDEYGRLFQLLTNRMWDDPVTEKPVVGTKEIWNLINTTGDTHPVHLHLVQFQILQRRPFDVNYYNRTGKLRFTGPPIKPAPNERGFKDTVKASPGQVTKILARFGPYSGQYAWHCHIIEHEDHDMMRPFKVILKKRIKG
ncbi:multicopper oxidase domain-containing protein [Paenibacillus donghaensis]|uniref:multicopper oxidase family protein n=1 Tax=Paenibacillus donghaensis TaxID=414771 RepID=UPI0018845441|nr:multicopper oxidase [Paenibacillus donghaensis]MBE9914233.1 multicopper oxidase domain-containing protein [Paenibacillus donghaensis]